MNQQLVDYIKKESQRGVSLESTKNALLAIGWSEKDIKKTYDSLSMTSYPSNSHKKLIIIFVILLLIIAGGVSAFIFFTSTSTPTTDLPSIINTPIVEETPTIPVITPPSSTPPPAPIVTDVDKVTTIVSDMCKGYLAGDNSLILANASTETITLISNIKPTPVSSCSVSNIYQSETNIIASITTTPPPDALSSTVSLPISDMVFINENGNWKFDLTASTKFTAEQNKIKALSGDPNGFVDLMVTGIVMSPSHAIINKSNLKIIVTIKNIGTKTSDAGTLLTADLLGFKDETTMIGGSYEPLLPGGTVEWTWYPYKYNSTLKVTDIAGPKTIKIELNPDHKVTESNYENNIFTQDVQIYAK